MEGVFEDEHAEFAAGSYVRNSPTSRHTPWLGTGVTLFVRLWQFAVADRKHVVLGTASSVYRATTDRPAFELMPLFQPNNSMLRCASTNATRLSRIDWLWSAKRASVGSRRNRRRVKQGHPLMRIYIIGSDGIMLCRKAPATLNDGEIAVASNEELHAAPLSAKRLLALWNALPGVEKRKKVGDRDALIDQLWSAIELLPVPEPQPDPKRPSKQDVVIAMLRQPEGATVDEVASVTGWQRHTVRGVFSGTLKKKLGLTLASANEERGRVYRIAEPASV
jgi:uncharacterized protein DUF3489/ChrR-like protein with cupin domain